MAKKEKGESGERRERGESSSHVMHIWTERERRKKMRNMFSTLQSLLPDVPPKADKSGVVEEAVKYIKALEDTVQRLEKQKLEKLKGSNSLPSITGSSKQAMLSTREKFIADQVSAINHNNNHLAMERTNRRTSSSHLLPAIIQTWSSANVVLNVCGDDGQFVIYGPKKLGLFANICSVLDKHRLEAVFVHISSEANCSTYVIQACLVNRASHKLLEVFTVEERYKQAAGEIMMLVSS